MHIADPARSIHIGYNGEHIPHDTAAPSLRAYAMHACLCKLITRRAQLSRADCPMDKGTEDSPRGRFVCEWLRAIMPRVLRVAKDTLPLKIDIARESVN